MILYFSTLQKLICPLTSKTYLYLSRIFSMLSLYLLISPIRFNFFVCLSILNLPLDFVVIHFFSEFESRKSLLTPKNI